MAALSTVQWVELDTTAEDINLRLKQKIIFLEIRKNSATENCLPFTIFHFVESCRRLFTRTKKIISYFKNFERK
jgi:hypothetical protein